MRRFKSAVHLQRFASVHGVVQNLSEWVDTCYGRCTIAYCERGRSSSGKW